VGRFAIVLAYCFISTCSYDMLRCSVWCEARCIHLCLPHIDVWPRIEIVGEIYAFILLPHFEASSQETTAPESKIILVCDYSFFHSRSIRGSCRSRCTAWYWVVGL
jgi:hypothetical protein